MASEQLPAQDSMFGPYVTNFATVAAANAADLFLTTGQTTAMTALAAAFNTAYTASEVSKNVTKSKVATKNDARAAAAELFRSYGKSILNNPDISNALKAQLGMNVTPTTGGPVVPPANLTANPYANGVNRLSWKRNGNSNATVFVIEAQYGASAEWSFVAISSKTKFDHTGQIPGLQIAYRVSAQRAGIQSAPSNWTVVYPVAESEVVTLKAA